MQVLEALGHAPTLLNSNSTRFAKYIDLNYNGKGDLIGAKVNASMLEKSRVTLDSPNDRNYLIFYYMLSGLDRSTLDIFMLGDIQKHRITKVPEGMSTYQSREWNEKFFEWRQGMLSVGFGEEDLKVMYRMLAVIVLLCDLEFQMVKEGAAAGRAYQTTNRNVTNEILFVTNHEVLVKSEITIFLSKSRL